MSKVIETKLQQAFRELANFYWNKISQMDDWVNQLSYWSDDRLEVYNVSVAKVPAEEAGRKEAASLLIRVLNNRYLVEEETIKMDAGAQAIIDTLIKPLAQQPGFGVTALGFIAGLKEGKLPSTGVATAK